MAHQNPRPKQGIQTTHVPHSSDPQTRRMTESPVDPIRLSALVASRLCHDLISPIGAIGNGLELLDMAGPEPEVERGLIGDAVAQANARLRFFRISFGMADSTHRLGPAEVSGVLRDVTRTGRVLIDWQVPVDLPRAEVRRAFLLIQCVETALAYGGAMTVTRPNGHWLIEAEGKRLRDEPDLWSALTDGPAALPDPLSPANVHFALLALDLDRDGRRAKVDLNEGRLTARI